jgi:hypothetical protein
MQQYLSKSRITSAPSLDHGVYQIGEVYARS